MDPINFIEVLTTSVKPVPAPGKFRFELVTLNRRFIFILFYFISIFFIKKNFSYFK